MWRNWRNACRTMSARHGVRLRTFSRAAAPSIFEKRITPMGKKKLGVAVIGSGSIATHRHAPEYAANPSVEILAFVDRVQERAEKLAKKYGAKPFTRYEDVLDLKGVDAVSVCTPN